MFYRPLARFPKPPVAREFFCFRCQKVMKIYAIVGLTLLTCVVTAIVIATILLTR